jgi:hypothetical protein
MPAENPPYQKGNGQDDEARNEISGQIAGSQTCAQSNQRVQAQEKVRCQSVKVRMDSKGQQHYENREGDCLSESLKSHHTKVPSSQEIAQRTFL